MQHQQSPVLPAPGQRAAVGHGQNIRALNVHTDTDDVIRRVPLIAGLARPNAPAAFMPLLAAETLRVAQQASTYVIRSSGAGGEVAYGMETSSSLER